MNPRRLNTLPARTWIAASIAAALACSGSNGFAQTVTESELARKLDQLAAELATVKAQLAQLQQQSKQPQRADASPSVAPMATPVAEPNNLALAAPAGPATVLTSYGEINYNRPTHATEKTQIDLRRFVLGYQHRFDEKTKVVAELEVEHAVASSGDPGEVAIEQAYIERQFTPTWAARAGLFLMPVGLINENHEPTSFYGVERNFVETAIIPSTWREGGVQIVGTFDNGLTVQGGVASSFNLNKWDLGSTDGKESPLGSIHQELAKAKGHDLAVFGAVNWRGVPGLLLGGSLFTGQATQAQTAVQSRITLWDLHARWTPGRWDFSTLYTRANISNTAALNGALLSADALKKTPTVDPTLIPKSFDGYYVQGAYKLWSHEDYALTPFVRWEHFNTARAYADLGPGLTPEAGRGESVITLGANFQVAQGVVVKTDYQRFREDRMRDRFNLGLGWSF